ncbi:MAG: hypothetical protein MEQ74_05060 [Paracoccus sp.]|nr:hypothetical protein [Paracoccus sp. (in: a-proteobacteria)]
MSDDPQTIAREKLIAAGFKRHRDHLFLGKLWVTVRENGRVEAEFPGDDVTVDYLLDSIRLDRL